MALLPNAASLLLSTAAKTGLRGLAAMRAPPPPKLSSIQGVTHTVAISSAKGGVGKSTTAGLREPWIPLQPKAVQQYDRVDVRLKRFKERWDSP